MQRLFLAWLATLSFAFAQNTTVTTYLSHIADGSGWSTTFTVVNLTDNPGQGTVHFHAEDGSPLMLLLNSANPNPQTGLAPQPVSSIDVTVPAHGIQTFSTFGTSPAVTTGWADFIVDLSTAPLSISTIFRRQLVSRMEFEASVFGSSGANRSLIVSFDNTSGFSTGIAVINAAPLVGANYPVIIRDASGQLIQTDTISLNAASHTSFSLGSRYPLTDGRMGTIEIQPDTTGAVLSALALRFNPTGAFTTLEPLTRQ